ncbi:MAG: hypothetical protein ACLUFI_08770 [Oscillospiraceae bacterium]
MNYKKTYVPAKGYTPICKIGRCSLKKLEFGIIELDAGEKSAFLHRRPGSRLHHAGGPLQRFLRR